MNSLAERLADHVRDLTGVGDPPVDLRAVAAALGIYEIRLEELVEDGRIEDSPNGRVILLRAGGTTPARRRFTLAHELGHQLLADPHQPLLERRTASKDADERFCDDFAAALLLPREWLMQFGDRPPTLRTLRHVSDCSRVSLAACLVRFNEVLRWNQALLHWRRDDSAWRIRFHAGLPQSLHGRVRSASDTSDVLDGVAAVRTDQRLEVPVRIGRSDRRVRAEVSIRNGSALVLAPLREFNMAKGN